MSPPVWPAADPIIGLVITVAILLVICTASRDVFRRLMDGVDTAVPSRLVSAVSTVSKESGT